MQRKADRERETSTAKAEASGTNRGAVEKGDELRRKRLDLAEKVKTGEMKATEARRQMKKDEVSGKVEDLPKGTYRVFYADPLRTYTEPPELHCSILERHGWAQHDLLL